MKKLLRFTCLVASGVWMALSAQEAKASHAQGSDLTYVNVGPNMYIVNYKLYRDCTGIDPGTSQQLTYRAPGCDATARNINMPLVGNPVVGDPYCAGIPAPPCSGTSSALANYAEYTYSATITLPSLCNNWILSARIGNRPSSRNLASGQSAYLFSEALINNLATQTNNSPTFGNIPIPFVCVDRQITYNQNVTDVDGDSVVYTLAPALNDLNTPVVYGNFLGTGTGTNPYPAGTSPAGTPYPSANFSATNPIISRNPLSLDRLTGSMVFEPLSFRGPSFPADQGQDKYTVAVQVDEYRKINGVATKIGHVRRDILIIVVNCNNNDLPALDSIVPPGGQNPVGPTTVIEVEACSTATLKIRTKDPNPQDIIRITSNATQVIPQASFTVTGGARPIGTFTWTPTLADVRPAPYRFNVTIRDNACPIPGFQTQTVEVRVIKQNFATATAAEDTICAGNNTMITAETTRPDSIPNYFTKILEPAIYTYRWDPAPGLADADTMIANPVVSPLVTTRYRVRIFSPDPYSCFDTASVLVTVQGTVPQIDSTFADNAFLCPGESTPLTVRLKNEASGPYFYAWSPGTGLSDSTIANPIATPLAGMEHIYRVRVYNAEGCDTIGTVTVVVGDSIVPEFDVPVIEASAPVEAEFKNTTLNLTKVEAFKWEYSLNGGPRVLFDNSDEESPVQTFDKAGEYEIFLTTFDDLQNDEKNDDCPKTVSHKIIVPEFSVPNIITPNGDKKNDALFIRGLRPGSSVKIYNRWGSVVKEFSSYDNKAGWNADGASDGIYYYIIKDTAGKETKGWIEVVR